MNPGTVDVAVFPPISVSDWTVDTLSDRIAEVRQLYVDALADWPVDELPEHRPVPEEAGSAKAGQRKAAAKKAAQEGRAKPRQERPASEEPARPAKKTVAKKAAA